MDDGRIRQLAEEVLAQLAGSPDTQAADLESRVAALERTVRELQAGRGTSETPTVVVTHLHTHPHPSLQVLGIAGGSDRCVVEPDKPCVQSGQCRALGH